MHLKRESEKKDYLIQDLLKKLNDALETIKAQSDQIKSKFNDAITLPNHFHHLNSKINIQLVMTKNNEAKLYHQQQQQEAAEQVAALINPITDIDNSNSHSHSFLTFFSDNATQLLSAESRLVASAVIDLKNPVPSLPPEFRLLG
jgi:small-conductance mechanosensitive channel